MKREYIMPQIKIREWQLEDMLTTSGVSGDNGIKYGGVDEEGTKEPSARWTTYSVWDEEEE